MNEPEKKYGDMLSATLSKSHKSNLEIGHLLLIEWTRKNIENCYLLLSEWTRTEIGRHTFCYSLKDPEKKYGDMSSAAVWIIQKWNMEISYIYYRINEPEKQMTICYILLYEWTRKEIWRYIICYSLNTPEKYRDMSSATLWKSHKQCITLYHLDCWNLAESGYF